MIPRYRFGSVACGLALLTSLSGCSLLLVKGPPEYPDDDGDIQCTTTNALSIVDGVFATYLGMRTGYALTRSERHYENALIDRDTDILLSASMLALWGVSMHVGSRRVSDCHKALREARLARARAVRIHQAGGTPYLRRARPRPAIPAVAPADAVLGRPPGESAPPSAGVPPVDAGATTSVQQASDAAAAVPAPMTVFPMIKW